MKIGVISDTHISPAENSRYSLERSIANDPELLCAVLEPYFKDVDAIIHAGDVADISVIDALERFAGVYAVAGNMDPGGIHRKFGEKKIVELGGFRIGLIHGWGGPHGLPLKVRQKFNLDNVNCIVFGHSHSPYNRIEENILMFNPGSPTDKRFAESRNVGILHLEDKIWGEHVRLDTF